ncbi:MAG: hypothetical protein HFJ57_06460 [Clostridia bacterium]|nr:hypothetical protein [Clostridia bacterium]
MKRNIMHRRYAMLQRRCAMEHKKNQRLKKELAEHEEFFGTLELCIPKDIDKN